MSMYGRSSIYVLPNKSSWAHLPFMNWCIFILLLHVYTNIVEVPLTCDQGETFHFGLSITLCGQTISLQDSSVETFGRADFSQYLSRVAMVFPR